MKLTRSEIKCIPHDHRPAQVEGKRQGVRCHLIVYGLDRSEIGTDGLHVLARHPRVIGKRHRRIKARAVARPPASNGIVEFRVGPGADAGVAIGGDVWRYEMAERRLDHTSTGERPIAARYGVTAAAVRDACKIAAALDL